MKYKQVLFSIRFNGLFCYLQSGKFDMAGDLLKKCLQYNKVRIKSGFRFKV